MSRWIYNPEKIRYVYISNNEDRMGVMRINEDLLCFELEQWSCCLMGIVTVDLLELLYKSDDLVVGFPSPVHARAR